MPISVFKPIRIFWQDGVGARELQLVLETTKKFLSLAGVSQKIIIEFGESFCLDDYINKDGNSSWFGAVDAGKLIEELRKNRLVEDSYYDLAIVKERIYLTNDNIGFVLGAGQLGQAAVVEINNSSALEDPVFLNNFIGTIFHELGHVFGLMPQDRTERVIISYGVYKHCGYECAMYPYDIPKDVDIGKNPFCPLCLRNLLAFFKNSV